MDEHEELELKNGGVAVESVIAAARHAIEGHWDKMPYGPGDILQLVESVRDPGVKITEGLKKRLIASGVLDEVGKLHPTVRDILLSMVKEDEDDVELISPLASESQ